MRDGTAGSTSHPADKQRDLRLGTAMLHAYGRTLLHIGSSGAIWFERRGRPFWQG
jgi:hypothetical protein